MRAWRKWLTSRVGSFQGRLPQPGQPGPLAGPELVNEHFMPEHGLDLKTYIERKDITAVHHLLRYQWATVVLADICELHSVLDIACGSGYGTWLMAKRRPDVQFIGVDYDPVAIAQASERFQLPNIKFQSGDALRWTDTIGPDRFDVIVSFDTIEHVDHREIMMENIAKHLMPAGQLMLSTPCGSDELQLQPAWTAHKIEYSSASLYDFLHRYFRRIIRPDDRSLPHLDVFDVLKDTEVTYMLRMNPVLCLEPVVIANPYHGAS